MPEVQAGELQPDQGMIMRHLQRQVARWHELPEDVWLEIRMFRAGGDEHPLVLHSAIDDAALEAIAGDIVHWNAKERNVYSVRNPVRRNCGKAATDADIVAAFCAWADCDDPDSARNVKEFVGPAYTYAVTTGTIPHVRPHPYWEFTEPVTDLAAWTNLQRSIARRFGSDRTVINPSRIMRVAGTISYPDSKKRDRGYVQELVTIRTDYPDADQRKPVPFDQLQRAFASTAPAAAPQGPASAFDINLGADSMDRQAARSAALAGDEWHNNTIRLVASYVAKGLADPEIHALTDHLTLPGWTVEQTRAEVQKAIDGARAKGWTPVQYADPTNIQLTPNSEPTQVSTADDWGAARPQATVEWFDDIEPALDANYIVKGVLGTGAMSVIYGASNSGKTFFALDMAFHIAIGAEWRGHRVKGGGVLYLAAEGGAGLINRVSALKQTQGVCDVPLAVKRAGLDLLKSTADLQQVTDLAALVAEKAPLHLIVVDTLSRVMAGGDENSAQDMTALIRNLDAIRAITGAHLMLIHHSGKDAAKGARGHSSLRAATDTEIEVEDNEGDRAAWVRKQRDYQGGEVFPFTLKAVDLGQDSDGDQVSSCVVEATDSAEHVARQKLKKGLGGNQKIIADAFDLLISDGAAFGNPGGTGFPERGEFWCVEYDRLRSLAVGKMQSSDPGKAFKQAFDALTRDRGLFCMTEKCVWRTDRKKKQ